MTANSDLPALKARLRLSSVIGKSVKLKRRGGDWWGPCPFHTEKTASFSVNDHKGFYHCFGCSAHGDVLDWWQQRDGLRLQEAIDRLKAEAGNARPWREETILPKADDAEALAKRQQARAIWDASQPIKNTMAARYLKIARCIDVPLPQSLRYHQGLPVDARGDVTWPAMVAAVTDLSGDVIAIQRTFIARDGSSKAMIDTPKRSLAPLKDGAVRLANAATTIGIAEGIETGLSAMQLFAVPVWCALGSNLKRIALPPSVRNVAIFADRGEAGERAASEAREHFHAMGRKVNLKFPATGKDFNDELKARRNGSK